MPDKIRARRVIEEQDKRQGRHNAIGAEAFGRDPEVFAFTRSLTSYERALRGENSSMVMAPDSEFFDYLKTDQGR